MLTKQAVLNILGSSAGIMDNELADLIMAEANKPLSEKDIDVNIVSVCLVPMGYQIDLLDHKSYIEGKLEVKHSECRDYGEDIDVAESTDKLIEFIRKGNSTLVKEK